jgi:hypothetical protein
MKLCTKCNIELSNDKFYKRKDSKDGLSSQCSECRRKVVRKYYSNNSDKWKKYSEDNKEYIRVNKKRRLQERRLDILTYYSSGKPKCSCCGESHIEFLTIHHIDNDGAIHRKEIGGSSNLPKWIIDNNYPAGFSVLCYNCNCAIGNHGYCPHDITVELC